MADPVLVTRRMILKDMGKAGLAVVLLGTAACAEESGATTTTAPGGTTSSTSAAAITTATSPAAAATTTTSDATSGGHEWQRVNLDFVSAYILHRGGEAALVDTGVAGSGPAIEAALAEIGLEWASIGHVIVTHEHPDHQGGVADVLAAVTTPWYAGAGDIEAITAPTEGTVVGDGDTVFDLEIIETPGHTEGHISVLDPTAGILVAGDALTGSDGGIAGPNPQFTPDMDLANASVAKLAGFDYEIALPGHGEPVLSGASAMVAELAGG